MEWFYRSSVYKKYFIIDLNEKSSRNIISEEKYGFTYQISNDYSLNSKIIQQEFEAKDIISIYFLNIMKIMSIQQVLFLII